MLRLRLGEVDVFEALFHSFCEPLCAFIFGYVGSADVAEDLAQETFTRLWAQRSGLDTRGSVVSWIYTAGRNCAFSYLRHVRVVARSQERVVRENSARAASSADEGAAARRRSYRAVRLP